MKAGKFSFDRRQIILGSLLGSAGLAIGASRLRPSPPQMSNKDFATVTPPKIGQFLYKGDQNFILPEDDMSSKIYTNVRLAAYDDGAGAPLMLLVAYDNSEQHDGLQLHRPENCYRGSGFSISKSEIIPVKAPGGTWSLPSISWTAQRADRIEQVLYWTRIGDLFPVSDWDQKVKLFSASIHVAPFNSVLVRLSVVSNDRPASIRRMQAFLADLAHDLPPVGQRILYGPAIGPVGAA